MRVCSPDDPQGWDRHTSGVETGEGSCGRVQVAGILGAQGMGERCPGVSEVSE